MNIYINQGEMIFVQPFSNNFLSHNHIMFLFSFHFSLSIVFDQS